MAEFVVDRENVWPYGFQREEVVRCRDCKHILRYHGVDPETGLPIGAEDWRCNHFKNREGPLEISPNGFCAWGVRRTDG